MSVVCKMTCTDVKDSDKTGSKCPLTGELVVDGVVIKVAMVLSADARDAFEMVNITGMDDVIDIEFRDSAQQTL